MTSITPREAYKAASGPAKPKEIRRFPSVLGVAVTVAENREEVRVTTGGLKVNAPCGMIVRLDGGA